MNKLSLAGLLISLVTSVPNLYSQVEFEKHIVTQSFSNGYDVCAFDMNNDGKPDLLAAGKAATGEVSLFLNDGFNSFTKTVLTSDFQGARSVRAGDINGDEFPDVVSGAWQANEIRWWENDGNLSFTERVVDPDFTGAHTVDIKDVNGDGYPDILCSGFDYYGHQGEIAWWENDGMNPPGWTKHLISDRFQQSPFIYGEDIDGDDDMDILACGELNGEVLWWENNGNEVFTEHMIDSLFTYAHTVIARDVDLDGDFDVVGSACMSSRIAWWENDGNQQFTKHPLPNFAGALWLDAMDLDNDGDRDLYGAGMSAPQLAWWENNGSQVFTKHAFADPFTQAFCVVPAMMDNDNDTDLVAIGSASHTIAWFENKLEDPNPYYHPECCVFDYQNDRWLISNTGADDPGYILEVNDDGETGYFITGIPDPLGMCIGDGVLYVSDAKYGVRGYDLATKSQVFDMPLPATGNIDGQTYAGNGQLFAIDTYGKIIRIDVQNNTWNYFVTAGLTQWIQDCVYDEANNRLLSIGYKFHAPIQAISLSDSSVTDYPTTFSNYDGITMDQSGNVYLASHQSLGYVIRYDNSLTGDPEIISQGHDEPAGLHFNKQGNILAVPNYQGNSVDFIPVNVVSMPENSEDGIRLNHIYPNPVKDKLYLGLPGLQENIGIRVFDLNGRLVIPYADILFRENASLDVSDLPDGIYLLNLNYNSSENFTRKFVVKR